MGVTFNPFTGNFDIKGSSSGGAVAAADVTYDNSGSGLTATDVQAAIDELAGFVNNGDPNTFAYYNATGDLTSDTRAKFNDTLVSVAIGDPGSGSIAATGAASFTHGSNTGTGSITSSGIGSSAAGSTTFNGTIVSSNNGTTAFGEAKDGATILASGLGTLAFGHGGSNSAGISATADGASAFGHTSGTALLSTAKIDATASGSMARGQANDNGIIQADGVGSYASGVAYNEGVITTGDAADHIIGVAFGSGSSIQTPAGTSPGDNGPNVVLGMVFVDDGSSSPNLGVFDDGGAGAGIYANLVVGSAINASSVRVETSTLNADSVFVFGRAASLSAADASGISEVFSDANGSFTYGRARGGGKIANHNSGTVLGFAEANVAARAGGTITGYSNGGITFGMARNGGAILGGTATALTRTVNRGAFTGGASGGANGADNTSLISTSGDASFAFGNANDSGTIESTTSAAFALGHCSGTPSLISARQNGALAVGRASGGATIESDGPGALAFGDSGNGSSVISTTGQGALAGGWADDGAAITASSNGAIALGAAENGQNLAAQAAGAFAMGNAQAFSILSLGNGSFAGGFAGSGDVTSSGDSGFTHGDQINNTADFGQAFGVGHEQRSYLSMVLGRFSNTPANNPTTWVATDPLFVVANGASGASRSNAFQVDKDGTLYINDPSLVTASVGYVWKLQNQTTGEGAWAPDSTSSTAITETFLAGTSGVAGNFTTALNASLAYGAFIDYSILSDNGDVRSGKVNIAYHVANTTAVRTDTYVETAGLSFSLDVDINAGNLRLLYDNTGIDDVTITAFVTLIN